jgi:DNA-binding MarR family transcriptional regulator
MVACALTRLRAHRDGCVRNETGCVRNETGCVRNENGCVCNEMVAYATIIGYEDQVPEEFRALFQELIRKFGLLAADRTPCGKPLASSDAHALMLLREIGEAGMMPSTLAAKLGVDKSTATRTAARLVDSGHIESIVRDDDGRARPIRLTKKGARMAEEVEHASRDRFSQLLKRVPAQRRAAVVESMRDLVTALDALIPGDNP